MLYNTYSHELGMSEIRCRKKETTSQCIRKHGTQQSKRAISSIIFSLDSVCWTLKQEAWIAKLNKTNERIFSLNNLPPEMLQNVNELKREFNGIAETLRAISSEVIVEQQAHLSALKGFRELQESSFKETITTVDEFLRCHHQLALSLSNMTNQLRNSLSESAKNINIARNMSESANQMLAGGAQLMQLIASTWNETNSHFLSLSEELDKAEAAVKVAQDASKATGEATANVKKWWGELKRMMTEYAAEDKKWNQYLNQQLFNISSTLSSLSQLQQSIIASQITLANEQKDFKKTAEIEKEAAFRRKDMLKDSLNEMQQASTEVQSTIDDISNFTNTMMNELKVKMRLLMNYTVTIKSITIKIETVVFYICIFILCLISTSTPHTHSARFIVLLLFFSLFFFEVTISTKIRFSGKPIFRSPSSATEPTAAGDNDPNNFNNNTFISVSRYLFMGVILAVLIRATLVYSRHRSRQTRHLLYMQKLMNSQKQFIENNDLEIRQKIRKKEKQLKFA
eukprot:MONOS_1395.1-p1 / transcript=MONOS_1395.1 / gene=MONOS_1395 / organism=Monocercomonoides_exilis_PA203 / gene_product=unspecified product / transcript_product=unspecified product / location=Mono_scaffold00024:104542-106745(+) / protein_length=512 / sequence_SO=supercontig / SO=protein_coding / is_pseudo=false